jgi:hypothetical protein
LQQRLSIFEIRFTASLERNDDEHGKQPFHRRHVPRPLRLLFLLFSSSSSSSSSVVLRVGVPSKRKEQDSLSELSKHVDLLHDT